MLNYSCFISGFSRREFFLPHTTDRRTQNVHNAGADSSSCIKRGKARYEMTRKGTIKEKNFW